MSHRWLSRLVVDNESRQLARVLAEVPRYTDRILIVDDGSTCGAAELLTSPDCAGGFR